jgi:hypothetical protein
MFDDPPARCRRRGHEQARDNGRWAPSQRHGHGRRQAGFRVQASQQVLEIRDDRLDLDDGDDPARRVARKEIDAPSLAEVAERPLCQDLPCVPLETASDGALERSVIGVEQPRQLASAPAGRHRDIDLQDGARSPQRGDGERPDVARFEVRDPGLAQAGAAGDVELPPAPTEPDGTEGPRHLNVSHGGHAGSRPLPAHACCLSGR